MPIYQIDYIVKKNLVRQVIKYYPGINAPYKIFIYINLFNAGYNKQRHTLEDALQYAFDIINKAHDDDFWNYPSYMKMLKLPEQTC